LESHLTEAIGYSATESFFWSEGGS
jgi:hypothetical protein